MRSLSEGTNNLPKDFDDLLETFLASLPEIGAWGCLVQDSNVPLWYLPHTTSPNALLNSDGLSVPLAELTITVQYVGFTCNFILREVFVRLHNFITRIDWSWSSHHGLVGSGSEGFSIFYGFLDTCFFFFMTQISPNSRIATPLLLYVIAHHTVSLFPS